MAHLTRLTFEDSHCKQREVNSAMQGRIVERIAEVGGNIVSDTGYSLEFKRHIGDLTFTTLIPNIPTPPTNNTESQ